MTTSPHLSRFAERIRIDGMPLEDEPLAFVLERALATGVSLTFFEAAMIASFLAFREARVDLAIVEVGLGGRLDATNVIPSPVASALVSVGLDHCDYLGDTLAKIAWDKAHIAKPGRPFVLGPALDDQARASAVMVARARNAEIIEARDTVLAEPSAIALRGAHQLQNAQVAATLGRLAGLPENAIQVGLRAASWPGRFERIDGADGPFLLDGAHNEAGARALVETLECEGVKPAVIVFGAMADKPWKALLEALRPLRARHVYVEPAGRKPATTADLDNHLSGICAPSVSEALREARRIAGPDGVVLVTGSLYLVGEVRTQLLGLPRDPPVAL